jgi:GH15 family glucan-1,4-alpha-glucosidase
MPEGKPTFWTAGENGRRRIEDYGIIGDSETAALVSRTGSIDWLCWPRFDSEACMAALLGNENNGFWRIAPKGEIRQTSRRYRGDTLILETLFETDEGKVLLVDLMPLRGHNSDIVRVLIGVEGRVTIRSVLDLRFQYGKLRPLIRRVEDQEVSAIAGPHGIVLRSDRELQVEESAIIGECTVAKGEQANFVLTYYLSHREVPDPVDVDEAIEETEGFWEGWAACCTYEGTYRDQVVRSLVTLKALTYHPTGGTVAAATASLPEAMGGERNWDYRYCWLRDAAFMLLAFVHAGYPDEAAAWRDWLIRAGAGEPGDARPLYTLDGSQGILEWTAPWLSGFNGSRPVRFGNAAHDQLQLDIFGEVVDAFHLARRHGLEGHEESWELQRKLLQALEKRWREPDAGIWEIRSAPQNFVHSKALAWAAFDRGIRSFQDRDEDGEVERWTSIRDEIREEVLAKGFDGEKNSFVRSYESRELDASTLLLPIIGFIDAKDPRAVGTTEAIEKDLVKDGLVLRYDTRKSADGLPPGEGAFLASSFWLVDNYHLQGRTEEAHALFERLLGLANDLGLLSEQYDAAEGIMLGNFPQALSHLALVNCALNLSDGKGPAEERLSLD